MNFLNQLLALRRLHHLIERKATGSTRELSAKLNISKSSLYRQIDLLKNLGASIAYDHDQQRYYYQEEFNWQWEVLRKEENV